MNTYAYVRVSSAEQNEDRQVIAMRERSVPEENIFIDKQSGKDFERPGYKKLIKMLKEGDLLYIMSIDRLGRNYDDIQDQWRVLTRDIGADICVLDMPLLDTREYKDLIGRFVADLTLQILSYFAQNEREKIRERQEQGIKAAKMRGVMFGRPRKPLPNSYEEAKLAFQSGEKSLRTAAAFCGMAPSTFYSIITGRKK